MPVSAAKRITAASIVECAYDPWRFQAPALEPAERGIPIVEFPQSNARIGPASERLHAAIVEGRLSHPDDSSLNAHVRAAIARDTPRGWRIDKLKSRDNIDALWRWQWPLKPQKQAGARGAVGLALRRCLGGCGA
jgi:phage terminase large subunit-like protein